MVAITSRFAPSLALLLFLAPAVLANAAGIHDGSSCFASAGIAFRTNGCRQMPPLSRWQQTASSPIVKAPTLEFGSKVSASERDNNDGRDEIDGIEALSKKRLSLRFRQRMRKVAKVTSLALLHFTALRLRPGSAVAADATAGAPPAPRARPASGVRMLDDDRRVVPCSIKPGAIQAEDGTFVTPETGETGTLLHDFGGESDDAVADATDANASSKKLSRKERRALRRQQRQKEKQWEEYGDEDEDDDEDFASGDGNLLSDGGAAAAAAAPGMGAPGASQGGYMTRPPGVTGMSDKAKSNIQAKVILIAGGGYAVSCFGYEGWQWNKEQKKVETSIEILGEQAKELGLKLETNATATDEEIADELRNITDASEGEDDDVGNNDDEDDGEDDDDDEPESPRRRPRKPIRPTPGDDDDDDDYGGGMGGAGDGLPSADDLNKLNNLFKKS